MLTWLGKVGLAGLGVLVLLIGLLLTIILVNLVIVMLANKFNVTADSRAPKKNDQPISTLQFWQGQSVILKLFVIYIVCILAWVIVQTAIDLWQSYKAYL